MRDMLIIAFVIIAFFAVVVVSAIQCETYKCARMGERANRKTSYEALGGECFVEVKGRMIPQGSWRGEEDR